MMMTRHMIPVMGVIAVAAFSCGGSESAESAGARGAQAGTGTGGAGGALEGGGGVSTRGGADATSPGDTGGKAGSGTAFGGNGSDCEFGYSLPGAKPGTCRIPASSQDSCGDAARCICATTTNPQSCIEGMTVARSGINLASLCALPSVAPTHSLGEAIQKACSGCTAVTSTECQGIPAFLAQ